MGGVIRALNVAEILEYVRDAFTTSNNECREPQADRVVEKEKANFCDYFKPNAASPGQVANSRDAMKAAAEALFKKK
jgi:hypothetical protein